MSYGAASRRVQTSGVRRGAPNSSRLSLSARWWIPRRTGRSNCSRRPRRPRRRPKRSRGGRPTGMAGSTAAPDDAKEKAAAAAAVAAAAAAGAAWDGGVGIGSHAAFFLKVGVTAAAADASWQSALRHLGCVELGLSVLRLPPPAGDAPARELRRLKHAAYALLAALCAGHADSQRAVFE